MTRPRKLREVLNVRLDEPLARELTRIAATQQRSESDVARMLLEYGIEVVRRLQAQDYARPFSWREDADEGVPGLVDVEARWRPMTDEELARRGWFGFMSGEDVGEGPE